MMTNEQLSRRAMLRGSAAAGGLVLLGLAAPGLTKAAAGAAKPKIVMHRTPTCGCCLKWAEAARTAGFDVSVVETDDIWAVKTRLGVPEAVASCHTSTAGGYVVEGHVPPEDIRLLAARRPKGVLGLAVPGMPIGSPGMEMGNHRESYRVFAFDRTGRRSLFASHG